jgi:hypothetical protein
MICYNDQKYINRPSRYYVTVNSAKHKNAAPVKIKHGEWQQMSSGIQHGFQSKAIDIVLNITAISAVVCTLQQLYPSGNNSNFAMAVSSSETILSIMAVGDSIRI